MKFHLGIDSTDSPKGGCTTYTMALIVDKLQKADNTILFLSYPRLVRLNPNIRIKTRGNAALGLSFDSNLSLLEIQILVKEVVLEEFAKYEDDSGKKPGIAIHTGEIIPNLVYYQSLQHQITIQAILAEYPNLWTYPESSQGIIGASVAATTLFPFDFTFELLIYRKEHNCGTTREINRLILQSLSEKDYEIFSSFDSLNKRELIAPSGPDPVFCGIRGNRPDKLMEYFKQLKVTEDLDSACLFISNQGTDDHVRNPQSDLSLYSVINTPATVHNFPADLLGGHLKMDIRIGSKIADLMVFQPTGRLRQIIRSLVPGDTIMLDGNIKEYDGKFSISAESIIIIDLVTRIKLGRQICPNGHTMTKAGKFKGYKCRVCGFTTLLQDQTPQDRLIFPGQRGYPDLSAQRHLTRPLSRLMIRNNDLKLKKVEYNDIRFQF